MVGARSKKVLDAGRRARVLIVDDSSVMRRLITLALEGDNCVEVVGLARTGKEAIERVAVLRPDVLTLDIEMPEMDGLSALSKIRPMAPETRIVMLSTLTNRGASATLEALALGADDYVTKQVNGKSVEESTAQLREQLLPKIKQFFSFSSAVEGAARGGSGLQPLGAALHGAETIKAKPCLGQATAVDPYTFKFSGEAKVVAIGVSTGGPTALGSILPALPADFELPVLLVQHMPPLFTKLLSERLQEKSALQVREAVHGEPVRSGAILLAPGDFHMRVETVAGERQPRIVLDQAAPENSCRPAVDVLFESISRVYGGATVAAILTGMGHDGLRGSHLLKRAGATIFAQDEETSAVWGMPRAVAEAGIADAVLPLEEIIPRIVRQCGYTRSFSGSRYQETR